MPARQPFAFCCLPPHRLSSAFRTLMSRLLAHATGFYRPPPRPSSSDGPRRLNRHFQIEGMPRPAFLELFAFLIHIAFAEHFIAGFSSSYSAHAITFPGCHYFYSSPAAPLIRFTLNIILSPLHSPIPRDLIMGLHATAVCHRSYSGRSFRLPLRLSIHARNTEYRQHICASPEDAMTSEHRHAGNSHDIIYYGTLHMIWKRPPNGNLRRLLPLLRWPAHFSFFRRPPDFHFFRFKI